MQLQIQPPALPSEASGFSSSLTELRHQFQILHAESPLRAVRLFLYYVAERGFDPVSQAMAFWATSGTLYVSLLLETDADCLEAMPYETCMLAIPLLNRLDASFLFKFARSTGAIKNPKAILRALRLIPALGDYSILVPWLRNLEHYADGHIRSRAAKLLCQLRPNKNVISRHLHSSDARIRAAVMEALWQPSAIQTAGNVLPFFQTALADSNHRVVANALVGLYRLGETSALEKMIAYCSDRQQLFRAAMAWAMGEVDDARAVPTLKNLTHDRSFLVRQRASGSLAALGYQNLASNCLVTG